MPVTLSPEARDAATASLRRYCEEELDVDLGHLASDALLDFILEEIGPTLFNQTVADVQARLHARITDLDVEFHETEFPYWGRRS